MASALDQLVGLLGPSGTLAGIMVAFVGLGSATDAVISDGARRSLGQVLLSGELTTKIMSLAKEIELAFEKVFGERHFSKMCLRRSAQLSLCLFVLVVLLNLLHDKEYRSNVWFFLIYPQIGRVYLSMVSTWFAASLVFDYLNLFRVRLLLRWLSRKNRSPIAVIALFLFDGYISILVIGLMMELTESVFCILAPTLCQPEEGETVATIQDLMNDEIYHSLHGTSWIALWVAGLSPSFWVWASVLATFLSRLAIWSRSVSGILIGIFPFESAPCRSIGVVAGLLTCVGYLAISGALAWIK